MKNRWIAAPLALALILAACGGDDSTEADAESAEPAAAPDSESDAADAPADTPETSEPAADSGADPGAFPVTITHMFGEATIEEEPERVLVAGLNELDYLYALGVAPVGYNEWWGGYQYGTGPWAEPVRAELGAEPEQVGEFEINLEAVAALHPDLIIVTYADIEDNVYDQLAEIAPVVGPHPDYEIWMTPWREELRLVAKAVGRSSRAEEIITEVDTQIEQIKADHPELQGAAFDTGYLDQSGFIGTYSSGDIVNQFLSELGMHVPESYDEMADGVYIEIALENLDLLDELDTFIWLDDTGEMPAAAEEIATFAATRLAKEGRHVLPTYDMVLAMAFNTPLSIPWYLDQLVPMLEAALDGDPATTAIS